jgi:TatD DNase family protein
VTTVYRLVDSHAHLEELEDLDAVLERACQAGIIAIIAVGSDYESNGQVLEIAAKYPNLVYPALGWHPGSLDKDVSSLEHDLRFIEDKMKDIVAIGEVGLDYDKRVVARSGKDRQKEAFRGVLTLAKRYNKPVIIHSRYAWRDSFTLAEDAGVETAIFHWYTGPTNVLKDILGCGYFISATLATEYHAEYRRAIKETPLQNLLLETDSPVAYRGHQAEPADVSRVLQATAELKGLSPAVVAQATTENALRLFHLPGIR